MPKTLGYLPWTFAFGLLFAGCGTGFLNPTVKEGVIEYALSFPDYDPGGIMAGMLPERTTLRFSRDQQSIELSAGMGLFRTHMVSDNQARSLDYHMSLMGKRLVSHLKPRDLELFNELGRPTLIFTGDIDTIAGMPCRHVVAIFDRIEHPEVDIWYTDRIAMDNPNWFGPFADVPGVLMRYEVLQYGMRMRLEAKSISEAEQDPGRFAPKADHQSVTPEVLHFELGEVLGTFAQ